MATLRFYLCLLCCCASGLLLAAEALPPRDSLPAQAELRLAGGETAYGLLLRRKRDGTAVLYLEDGTLVEFAPERIEAVRLTNARYAARDTRDTLADDGNRRSTAAKRRLRQGYVPSTDDRVNNDARFAPRLTPVSERLQRSASLDTWNYRVDMHSLSGSSKTVGFNLTLGLHFKALRRLGPQLLAGGGVGWDIYAPSSGEEVYPLYGTLHFYPIAKNRQLYAFANGGYGLAFKDELLDVFEAKGGAFAHAGLGTHLFSKSGHRLGIELGYKSQNAEFSRINNDQDIEVRVLRYQRITIGVWAYIFRKKDAG